MEVRVKVYRHSEIAEKAGVTADLVRAILIENDLPFTLVSGAAMLVTADVAHRVMERINERHRRFLRGDNRRPRSLHTCS